MHEFDLYFCKKIKNFNSKNINENVTLFKLDQKYITKNTFNKQKKFQLKKKIKKEFRFTTKIFKKLQNFIKFNKKKQIQLEIQKK